MQDLDYKEIGQRIRTARKEKGWSQTQFAEKLEMNSSLLCAYETGKYKPNLKSIAKIAMAVEKNIDYLILGERKEQISIDSLKCLLG